MRHPQEVSSCIARHFSQKWGGRNLALIERVKDEVAKTEGVGIDVSMQELDSAFDAIGSNARLSHDGCALISVRWFFLVHRQPFLRVINGLLASSRQMAALSVAMRPGGKRTRSPTLDNVRAVVPLTPIMQILDHILASRVHKICNSVFGRLEGVYHAALPGTQALEVAHAASLFMEKGTDLRGRAAFAQMDILAYFDKLPCLLVARWLVQHGLPQAVASAILRHQLLVQVQVCFRGASCSVGMRCSGTLTGSRTAGSLSRIPVQESFGFCHADLARHGFRIPDSIVLCGMSYVDNIYTAASNPTSAIRMCDTIAARLAQRWFLQIKPGSTECLLARGSPDSSSVPPSGWKYLDSMPVLGHIIQNDGGWGADFSLFSSRAWAAFFGNSGSQRGRLLDSPRRINLMGSTVVPHVRWSSPMWVPSATVMKKLDGMQNTMVSICKRIQRYPCEQDLPFFRRREKAVAAECRRMGRWSVLHRCLCVDWYHHCCRHTTDSPWIGVLLGFHDSEWLRRRRVESGSASSSAGRTCTCAVGGGVSRRWQEGVEELLNENH